MQLETLKYTHSSGWSAPFPPLDSKDTLVLVFGPSSLLDDPAPLELLQKSFPTSRLLGCSTSGEISGTTVEDNTITVAITKFEHAHLAQFSAPIPSSDISYNTAVSIAKHFKNSLDGQPLRSVLVLSDGLGVNGSELVRGFNDSLPYHVIVTGGLAGDGDRFKRTWVLKDGKPTAKTITAVAFYGDSLQIGCGSQGGWDIFGPERVVTRSEGNILYELDGQPALALYKNYLGERASGLPSTALLFPLSVWDPTDTNRKLVRTVLAVDEATNSLTFAGDLPTGHRAQLMRASTDRLIAGAAVAAHDAKPLFDTDGPALSIAISCVGRRLVLGQRTEDELDATLETAGDRVRQIGFYSYGEICPLKGKRTDLHNQTMTVTTIREAA